MGLYVLVSSNGYIDNIIVADPEFAESIDAKSYYPGASVGDRYTPIEEPAVTLKDLQNENKLLKAQIQAQTERSEFIEDCIAEMATMVYGDV